MKCENDNLGFYCLFRVCDKFLGVQEVVLPVELRVENMGLEQYVVLEICS